ncbi:hypothetical protein [Pectobacterium phage PcaP2EGY]
MSLFVKRNGRLLDYDSLQPGYDYCDYCLRIMHYTKMMNQYFCSEECESKRLGTYEEENK